MLDPSRFTSNVTRSTGREPLPRTAVTMATLPDVSRTWMSPCMLLIRSQEPAAISPRKTCRGEERSSWAFAFAGTYARRVSRIAARTFIYRLRGRRFRGGQTPLLAIRFESNAVSLLGSRCGFHQCVSLGRPAHFSEALGVILFRFGEVTMVRWQFLSPDLKCAPVKRLRFSMFALIAQ